jgi:hypothetical protein
LHLQRHVQALDGPLYLDGALLPLSPAGRLELTDTPGSPWADLAEIALTAFATAIGTQLEAEQHVFAVAKTQETTALVSTLATVLDQPETDRTVPRPTAAADSPLPWQTDRQFVSHLFAEHTPPTHPPRDWVFTPWLAQPKIQTPSSNTATHPLAGIELAHFPRELVERAYFFVRVPGDNGLYRVEAPLPVVAARDRDARCDLQLMVLREMASIKGTAEPISRADDRVSLGYEARHELREIVEDVMSNAGCSIQTLSEHNRDIRWQR